MTTNGSYMFVEMANERRYSFNAHTYFNNRLVFALTLLSPFRKRREKTRILRIPYLLFLV